MVLWMCFLLRGGASRAPGRGRGWIANDSGPISPLGVSPACSRVLFTCQTPQHLSHRILPGQGRMCVSFRMITCSEFGKGKARTWVLPAACSLSLGGGGLHLFAFVLLTWKLGSTYKFRWGNTFTERFSCKRDLK